MCGSNHDSQRNSGGSRPDHAHHGQDARELRLELYWPPYLFDELDSGYDAFLVNGPPVALDDSEKGMDGTVKHFTAIGNERLCDSITDRHGNSTTLSYTTVTVSGTAKGLLTSVTDPSGRSLTITWAAKVAVVNSRSPATRYMLES